MLWDGPAISPSRVPLLAHLIGRLTSAHAVVDMAPDLARRLPCDLRLIPRLAGDPRPPRGRTCTCHVHPRLHRARDAPCTRSPRATASQAVADRPRRLSRPALRPRP